MGLRGRLVFEPRPEPPAGYVLLLSILAIIAALLAAAVVFAVYGQNPWVAYGTIISGTLGDPIGLLSVLQRAVPIALISVGLVLAIRARFFNIGAEGQMLMGAVGAAGVALFIPLPAPFMLPAALLAGVLAGAAWGLLPALLKLRWQVNEVITTLMLNYVALYGVNYLIHGPWKGDMAVGYAYSNLFPTSAWQALMARSNVGLVTLALAVGLAALVAFILVKTAFGFRLRVLGENPQAARYAGVNALSTTLLVALLSAGAAGLAGAGEVTAIHHRLLDPNEISLGYGYTAIIAAWLARGNPLTALVTSVFLGVIFAGGDVMKVALQLPFHMTGVISGLILLFLISSEPLLRVVPRWVRAPEPAALQPTGGD